MDSQSYLNEIAVANRPQTKSKFSFIKSKFFIIGAAVVGALILMAIIGAVLSNGKASLKEKSITLSLRLQNTTDIIKSYQGYVKSSDLRSSSASLAGIVSNTSKELDAYLADTYKYDGTPEQKIADAEEEHTTELDTDLFSARINGNLDRIYAIKMAHEISLILAMEDSIYDSANNESLKEILATSYDSFENIYDKFDQFSETK